MLRSALENGSVRMRVDGIGGEGREREGKPFKVEKMGFYQRVRLVQYTS